ALKIQPEELNRWEAELLQILKFEVLMKEIDFIRVSDVFAKRCEGILQEDNN
ncbi:MAG: hypothetical protein EZS28_051309, partial [Streblomastix strix]